MVQYLADHQVDFDLGDELLIRDLGKTLDGRLVIGQRAYSVVIVPEGMDNWLGSTLERLSDFLSVGGTVLALREPPSHLNGRADPASASLPANYPEHWVRLDNRPDAHPCHPKAGFAHVSAERIHARLTRHCTINTANFPKAAPYTSWSMPEPIPSRPV